MKPLRPLFAPFGRPWASLTRLLATLLLGFAALSPLSAQVQVAIAPDPKLQFFDASGRPCAACKLYFYQAGTFIQQATYADSTGTILNNNPIVLDSGGFPPSGTSIWFSANFYKVVLRDSTGALIWSVDNVANTGLIALIRAVLLDPAGNANQTITGPLTAFFFQGSQAHTTSPGVRVAILDPTTVLDTPANPPDLITVQPAAPSHNYRIPDPTGHANFVLSPDPTQLGLNTLDCTLTGLTCKRYAFFWGEGGACNNTTAGMGWDTFGTNSPTPFCVTGSNIQKGVLALPSAVTKKQENTNSAAGAGTCTVTYPLATSSGDLLVGYAVVDSSRTVTGATDGTNAYVLGKAKTNGTLDLEVWYAEGSTGMAASSTLTFTFTGNGNSVCGFMAYQDAKAAGALDVTASNSGTGTAVTTGATAGTAQNTELVFSAVGSPGAPSVTFQSGTTGHAVVSQAANVTGSSEGVIAQAAGGQSGSFTLGSPQSWAAVVLAFKAEVGGTTTAQRHFMFPPSFQSGIAANAPIKWQAPLVPTGPVTVKLGAALVCSVDGTTDDPAFNATTSSTATVNASGANIVTQTLLNGLDATGCAPNTTIHYKIQRLRYEPADIYEGWVYINGAGLLFGMN